jgi:dipeptidyl aminopeptidase/acylaminoacyl peptidase
MAATTPYGSWKSPIPVSMLSAAGITLGQLFTDGDRVLWTESRPREGGRTAVVECDPNGELREVTPPDFDARTRVHEYGGGAVAVHGDVVIASRFGDQRVYRLDGPAARPITPEPDIPAGDRYADFEIHGDRVFAVRERHRAGGEPKAAIVVFPVDGSDRPRKLISGRDFYSTPRISSDGQHLLWLEWDHPNMPWDGTELWAAALTVNGVSEPEHIAGGPAESIFQPEWSPRGEVFYVSDRTGWWNLYRIVDGEPFDVFPAEAEFGWPQWSFGMRRYGFLPGGTVACIYDDAGQQHLAELRHRLMRIGLGRDSIAPTIAVTGNSVWVIAGSGSRPMAVMSFDTSTGVPREVRVSAPLDFDRAFVSRPHPIEFPTTGGATAHAFWYPPTNPDFVAPEGERPPLLVFSHGGPTSQTTRAVRLAVQFWTTRGFGVVDVNYRGSSGYGREYRNALRGTWGITDTEDCIAAARYLADAGHVDPERMAIRGGSAGGFTTLCALTFHDVFAAGASYYGVGDCGLLAEDTHKFESRYLDSLIGPYPEEEDLYRQRSPFYAADELTTPVILFQGLDDEVVLPEQAEEMVAALDANGVPHAYVPFAGEGHGFRRAETIERAAEAELSFYSQVFGFVPADDLTPVPIRHADVL